MGLRGGAIFLGWHDVAPEELANFYEWHDREHIPERIALPGFLRIRRFRIVGDGPLIVQLIEVAGTDVLDSPGYKQVATNPTEWTCRTLPALLRLSRGVFSVVSSQGSVDGGFLLLVKGVRPHAAGRELEDYLQGISRLPRVVAAHCCVSDSDGVVIVEAVSVAAAASVIDALGSPSGRAMFESIGQAHIYQLEVAHEPGAARARASALTRATVYHHS